MLDGILSHESAVTYGDTKCHINYDDSLSCMLLTDPGIVIHYGPVTIYVWNVGQQITTAKMQGRYSRFGPMEKKICIGTDELDNIRM